jgi:hypothetical protein
MFGGAEGTREDHFQVQAQETAVFPQSNGCGTLSFTSQSYHQLTSSSNATPTTTLFQDTFVDDHQFN